MDIGLPLLNGFVGGFKNPQSNPTFLFYMNWHFLGARDPAKQLLIVTAISIKIINGAQVCQ